MSMTPEKAMYFWHRHLEGADPEKRTLVKWNTAYPDNPTTLEEITGFIAAVQKAKKELRCGDKDAFEVALSPKLTVVKRPAASSKKGKFSGKADA
jgi:hypothetical protein